MSEATGLLGYGVRQSEDSELWDLAEELGLRVNRQTPGADDYRRVALALARLHHLRIAPAKAGRRSEWLPVRLGLLFAAFAIERRKPNCGRLSQAQICNRLLTMEPWATFMERTTSPAAALLKAYQRAAKLEDAKAYVSGLERLIEAKGEAAATRWMTQFFSRDDGQPATDLLERLDSQS
jgi:hypothetical protein